MSDETQNIPESFDFDSALVALTELVDSYSSEIYIPSEKKTVKVNEINASQQKELLGAAIDNSLYNTNFIKVFYNLLVELLGEDAMKTLTIFDKAALAIGIRKQISDKFKVQFDEKSDVRTEISLDEVLEKFKTYKHPKIEKFGDKDLLVTIRVPSISIETSYETEMHKKEKNVDDIKNTNDIKEIISKEFLGELSKFVNSMKIGKVSIDLDTLTFPQKIRLVEKLPSSIVQMILTKITEWKRDLDLVLTVENSDKQTSVIKIDPLLFIN